MSGEKVCFQLGDIQKKDQMILLIPREELKKFYDVLAGLIEQHDADPEIRTFYITYMGEKK